MNSETGHVQGGDFDILVVGGGINGVGVARDAAGRGLKVALCEKNDLAQGTSSKSTKFIHGGLRYLENYEFGLVRKSLVERKILFELAPHLARPMRLVLIHRPEMRPWWLIRLGLLLYDSLGGRQPMPRTNSVDLTNAPEGAPLRTGFKRGLSYWDLWCDDSRLVVANALDARSKGGEIILRHEMVSAQREEGNWKAVLRSNETGETRIVNSRAIVNSAGPWVESVVGRMDGVATKRRIRLVKGSHIVLRRWWDGDFGYVLQSADRRVVFVYPYLDEFALVGTTDVEFEGKLENAAASEQEVDYLIGIINSYFTKEFTSASVVDAFAGVRPLFGDRAETASKTTRDYSFEMDQGTCPAVTVFGGKLTTYRKLAEDVMKLLEGHFPQMSGSWTAEEPLSGGDMMDSDFERWADEFKIRRPWLSSALANHYSRTYGSAAYEILEGIQSVKELGRHFGGALYEKEARWLTENEWARSSEDILARRTKHCYYLTDSQKSEFDDWLESVQRKDEHREYER